MKLYVLLWKHETPFTNGAGEHFEPEECQDCGVFTSEEAARRFASEHLPRNANWDVFDGEYLFPGSTDEEIAEVLDIRVPTLEELVQVPDEFEDSDYEEWIKRVESELAKREEEFQDVMKKFERWLFCNGSEHEIKERWYEFRESVSA